MPYSTIYTGGNGELVILDLMFNALNRKTSLCWPAKYHVKRLAYDAMRSLFAKLEGSGEALTQPDAAEMRQLLELVNEILRAEAYTNDEEIPSFSDPTSTLSCAFCGGEVFQKAFRCRNKCLREGADLAPANIFICPSCYVDGRTCFCSEMTPLRLSPMAPMVTSRDEVATWLRSHSKNLLLSDDSEDDTDADRRGIVEPSVSFPSLFS